MRIVSVMAVATALVVSAPAYAASYVTDAATFTSIGDTIGSTYDQVALSSVTGAFTTAGLYAINGVSFSVGVNATAPGVSNGTFANQITIGGTPYTFNIPYTISINSFDTITFNSFSTAMGGYNFAFNPLTLSSDGSTVPTGSLSANVSAVPEPASWALMLLGFGAIGGAMRRRKVVTASASYA